jgi:hypothetical protein
VRRQDTTDNWVSVCGIIWNDWNKGIETYPNFEVVPSHCQNYYKCDIWRTEKNKIWKNQVGAGKRYSTIEQMDKISV